MKLTHGIHFGNLKGDIYGGLTAGIVALPLALAFGVASGAGPMAGIYGAVFVGFFAALFGGTPSQVSGPTGPMTVVMAAVITQYAREPALAFTVVMMGGFFQILFGALRLGSYINLVPFTVVSGFMSGIGCIILILQFAPLLGQPTPMGGTVDILRHIPEILVGAKWDAALVGLAAMAIAFLTPARVTRIVPAPLIALFAGTVAVWLWLPGVPTLGDIPLGFPEPKWPTVSWNIFPDMISSALILALLGSIDSLLTSLIADNVTRTHHESDRELIGQGIGNALAGLFGAIPGAGATMRTVINIRTGGQTPISGMIHAGLLLAIVLGLGPLASHIPHAVLAGILFKVGIDIIDWPFLRRLRRAPRASTVLMGMVLLLTVFVDLIVAVGVGVVAASLLFVKRMADLQLQNVRSAKGGVGEVPLAAEEFAMLEKLGDKTMYYHLSGALSFGAAKGMTRRIAIDSDCHVLLLDLSDVTFVDTSAALAIEDVMVTARDLDMQTIVIGLRKPVEETFDRLGVLKIVPPGNLHADRMAALRQAAAIAASRAAT